MHINYCEQGQSIETTCRKASEWGFDGIEFSTDGDGVEPERYLDQIAALCDQHGLEMIHFGGGLQFVHPSPAEREAAQRTFYKFYEQALRRFPLAVCNLYTDCVVDEASNPYIHYEAHGSALATDEMFAVQVKGLQEVAAFAAQHHFRFALETHHGYLHDLPAATMRLVNAVGSANLGVTFDYGNIIGFANAPALEASLDTVKDALFHVHLKNSFSTGTRQRQRCALGEGEINHRRFLRLLSARHYQGSLCLESPREGDREQFAQQDIHYFRSLLKDSHA